MDITDRFASLWARWDAAVHDRSEIPAFLSDASDEDLIELLAGAPRGDRKYECDVVATEILNRLHRRHRDLPTVAHEVLRSAELAYEAATEGQRAIHKAESILKAGGDEDLGREVSAAAYASLDTTRLAFEAAQRNSEDVHATVAQSRATQRLAGAAVESAEDAVGATREAASILAEQGHHDAAKEAEMAAARIERAADRTVSAVSEERAVEGDHPRASARTE